MEFCHLILVYRPVLQLEDVRSMFTTAEMALPESIERVPVCFLKAIDRTHRKLEVHVYLGMSRKTDCERCSP